MADHESDSQVALSAAVGRLTANASAWSAERIIDEGLDLIRDFCWASGSALYSIEGAIIRELRRRPAPSDSVDGIPARWFPWGLAPVNPQRYIFIEQAALLPATAEGSTTLGELGVSSCLHLPILERQKPIGSLQIVWDEPRLVWNDDSGRILRSLGRFLLTQTAANAPSPVRH